MANKNNIFVKGARTHNLKNVDVEIPRNKLTVITGLSGSGKSSLAFDTIFAEGQRRYVESLSAYARQFVGLIDKPDIDFISGLSPAISIDQKSASSNPRSTVGTMTEIYDYLRLLFSKIGEPHCPICQKLLKKYSLSEICKKIKQNFAENSQIIVAVPLDKEKNWQKFLEKLKQSGYKYGLVDSKIFELKEILSTDLKNQKNISIIIEKIKLKQQNQSKLAEQIKKGLNLGNGFIKIGQIDNQGQIKKIEKFSQLFSCPDCGFVLKSMDPGCFSFNSPRGACPGCSGLGQKNIIDPNLVFNPRLSIPEGAIKALSHNPSNGRDQLSQELKKFADKKKIDINLAIKNIKPDDIYQLLHGSKTEGFKGIIWFLEDKYKKTDSDYVRKEIEQSMQTLICPDCQGQRLKPEILSIKLNGLSISDISQQPIEKTIVWFKNFKKNLTIETKKIAEPIIKEIETRLNNLNQVGLNYLSLDRSGNTLSGGESQRVRLATQISTSLTNLIYVLDEPSIGLHQKDNEHLIKSIKNLRDLNNTVLVVEHDEAMIRAADWIIDMGPGAGEHGGVITAQGNISKIIKTKKSLTGQYLSGEKKLPATKKYRSGNGRYLTIEKATEHNLKNIDVSFPLGKLIAITGVSGSGKSTLMNDILVKALKNKFYRAKEEPGQHENIEGVNYINKIIDIDQSPIGRTPRSNPATYTNVFTPIRELFAQLPESKIKGYKAGHFSFNVPGGRCENCSGDGQIKIDMQFLPDTYIECEVCHGHRYQEDVLKIKYKEKNIYEILNLSIEEAAIFFKSQPKIYQKLEILKQVGLGYIKLGQSATTLSGGEAQRIKLATELSRKDTGKTLYILDEPTTGLHFDDIKNLLKVLNKLVDKGNTVIVIEHNLDVIKSSDWIIDLGPEGGDKGGTIIAEGTPKQISQNQNSWTGQYLKEVI